jgi:hypothetical protein
MIIPRKHLLDLTEPATKVDYVTVFETILVLGSDNVSVRLHPLLHGFPSCQAFGLGFEEASRQAPTIRNPRNGDKMHTQSSFSLLTAER